MPGFMDLSLILGAEWQSIVLVQPDQFDTNNPVTFTLTTNRVVQNPTLRVGNSNPFASDLAVTNQPVAGATNPSFITQFPVLVSDDDVPIGGPPGFVVLFLLETIGNVTKVVGIIIVLGQVGGPP